MKKKIRSSIIGILSSSSDDCHYPVSGIEIGKDLHEMAARILGLFIIFALIGIFAGWEEVSIRGLAALLTTATFEIAATIGSHIENRVTSFYVVKAAINAINAAWTSAVAVNIAVFYLFGKENYDGLSNVVGLLFFAMVVFAIGSVIKMIFMIILAATNSEATQPTENEGQETT